MLSTLFFTEMWERFTFYGMRALLVLFLVDAVQSGGLGLDDRTATAIYGLYTAATFMAALPGGWIADRLIGAQRAVIVGGLLMAAGSFAFGFALVPLYDVFCEVTGIGRHKLQHYGEAVLKILRDVGA